MITNPQVGMKVRWVGRSFSSFNGGGENNIGIIMHLRGQGYEYSLMVNFPRVHMWPCHLNELEYVEISSEEHAQIEDQQKRLAHAAKYL